MPALSVVVLNRKGGVGKTSVCFHLSGALARAGRRVLLVDVDSQANLTEGLLGASHAESLPPSRTIAALFDDALVADPASLVLPTPVAGVDILPGSDAMENLVAASPARSPARLVLRDFVAEVRDSYDVILLDCPPTIQLASWAALVAGDGVVVPLQVEDFGAQGIKKVQRAIAAVRADANPSLVLFGYLITMVNKGLGIHAGYAERLRAAFGDRVFATAIPLAKDYKEAVTAGLPVGVWKPKSAASRTIAALADELLARAAAQLGRREVA